MRTLDSTTDNNTRCLLLGVVLCFAFAFAIRVAHFSNEPITDELYHLLAAGSWVEDGTYGIADGEYTRARAFTTMVGLVDRISGGSVDAIRIFCITLGASLVAALFTWTWLYAGRGAAIIAGAILAIEPAAIFLSQYIRFYSLHALVFFLLAWCSWSFVYSSTYVYRWLLGAGIIGLALFGIHLQVTTLVGMAGIGLWAAVVKRQQILGLVPGTVPRIIAVFALTSAFAVLAFMFRDSILSLLATYRESALWNSNDNALYYYILYRDELGVLWSLAPLAIVVALLSRPAPAFFCTCIFITAFVIQSFGGMRSERFMFYALPWFFIIWGIAASALARALKTILDKCMAETGILASDKAWNRLRPYISATTIAAIAGFAVLTIPAFETFARMTLGKPSNPPEYWDRYRTHWQESAAFLRNAVAGVDVTVASQPLQAIYYLGDVDYTLNATTLADIAPPGTHSKMDPRTGRLVFDDVASLRQIVACNSSGAVIIHKPAWRNPTRVGDEVADFIEARFESVSIPTKSDLLLFRWSDAITDRERCKQ
ncbi:MAG TPA: hypothetical protein PKK10_04645 [Woeseiaceae bacterium]|nr:hypothetical protein [Woeseiaceae bacterium]